MVCHFTASPGFPTATSDPSSFRPKKSIRTKTTAEIERDPRTKPPTPLPATTTSSWPAAEARDSVASPMLSFCLTSISPPILSSINP
ncbi:hypothetical protein Dsin_029158 [Dipteronia sinensis]|uniref:Uncharacterized protein n=1 Tax=Dipteronia sinensis TaxID=43782 RepID=A0AAE0DW83_9ROSI|nr:hypothetical protein Dsin_029158 [Dipteronia sinensis]